MNSSLKTESLLFISFAFCLCFLVGIVLGDQGKKSTNCTYLMNAGLFSTDQANKPTSNFMKHVITKCRNPTHLALTYDDGVGPYTGKLLDILRTNRVRATFFVLGNTLSPETLYSEHHKHILVRMIREGHVVGSHSFDHPDLTDLGSDEIRSQLNRADALIQNVIGVRPRFFRPPFGYLNRKVADIVRKDGYILVNWNHDTNDWRHQDNHYTILSYIKDNIPKSTRSSEGPIILQHDTLKSSVALAAKIIRIIRDKGYDFVTIDKCVGQRPYRL